uniref:Uncharacterized protein n=1 Tax=Lygus hesperus TaxID=30085 RepID=A0A146L6Z7_LYGHE
MVCDTEPTLPSGCDMHTDSQHGFRCTNLCTVYWSQFENSIPSSYVRRNTLFVSSSAEKTAQQQQQPSLCTITVYDTSSPPRAQCCTLCLVMYCDLNTVFPNRKT